ncbi:MAG: VanW family protein, partial [Oscillospiraceae bacterium]|nr:VanW family protein [Oscillospiraceae bacterium]
NLIHWLCLHSPLTVTERHHHSLDPFPDDRRVVPFGSGATVSYNYLDYRFRNDTDRTFQLLFWFDDKCINGDLRTSEELPFAYHVFEKNHRFVKTQDGYYRRNELWRNKYLKIGHGEPLEIELLQKNDSLVKYVPEEYLNDDAAE